MGMLRKVKDYVTWGEIKIELLRKLLRKAQIEGGHKLTDEFLKKTSYKDIDALADAIFKNEIALKNLKGVKPVIRLPPPKKGYEGIKRHFTVGGALGYRGEHINTLLNRMLWDLKEE
jgi:large subunit ribosomal protein L30